MHKFFARHIEFVGNLAIMMSGKTIAAAIGFLALPVVARLFLPSDFGVAAMFVSIVGIVSSVATLSYGAALVLPREDHDAMVLLAFVFRVLASVCVIFFVLLGIYELSPFSWPALELLGIWTWLLPLGVFLTSGIALQELWLIRIKAFKVDSTSLVAGNAVTAGSRIGIGALLGSSVFGLIIGYLAGLTSRLVLQQALGNIKWQAIFRRIGWLTIRDTARRYSDFPKLNAPAVLLFSIGQNLPILLFGVMFSPVVAGYYAMADRLSHVPISIVATSTRQVFLQKAASIDQRGGGLGKAFLLSTGGLALIGAIPFTCVWLFGQTLLTWILGERWFEAGLYLEILAPWLFTLLVVAPCHPVLIVLREQRFWLFMQAVLTAVRLGSFGLSYLISAGPTWTLKAFVIVSVFGNLSIVLAVLKMISRSESRKSGSRHQH